MYTVYCDTRSAFNKAVVENRQPRALARPPFSVLVRVLFLHNDGSCLNLLHVSMQNVGRGFLLSQFTSDRDFSVRSLKHAVVAGSDVEFPAPGMDYVPYLSLQGKIVILLCAVGLIFMVIMLLLTVMCMRHRYVEGVGGGVDACCVPGRLLMSAAFPQSLSKSVALHILAGLCVSRSVWW